MTPAEKYLGVTVRELELLLEPLRDMEPHQCASDILTWLYERRIRPSPQQRWKTAMRLQHRCITCGKPARSPKSSHCNNCSPHKRGCQP